jgi:hypothetical protein
MERGVQKLVPKSLPSLRVSEIAVDLDGLSAVVTEPLHVVAVVPVSLLDDADGVNVPE